MITEDLADENTSAWLPEQQDFAMLIITEMICSN
jgi:hypothetical protein